MVLCNASILPGIARDSAEIARRSLEEAIQPTAAEVQGLLELHHLLTDLLRRSWEAVRDAMGTFIEAARLRAMLEPIRDGANALLDVGASLRRLMGEANIPREDLEASETTLRSLREETTKILDWMAAPRPPLDLARLGRGIAQSERGDVVNAEDFLAQLRTGEAP